MSKKPFTNTKSTLCELFDKLIKTKNAFIAELKQVYKEAREDYEKKKSEKIIKDQM